MLVHVPGLDAILPALPARFKAPHRTVIPAKPTQVSLARRRTHARVTYRISGVLTRQTASFATRHALLVVVLGTHSVRAAMLAEFWQAQFQLAASQRAMENVSAATAPVQITVLAACQGEP
jgi:hypothetical protein